jgi:hypothetical protein
VPRIVLVRRGQSIRGAQVMKEMAPVIPSGDQRCERAHPIQFVAHRVCPGRGEPMRVGVGHARRQVVRLVEQQQRARGNETRLFEKEAAIAGCEHVVVVSDPHIIEREGGAGDLVRTNPRIPTGGA